MSGVNLSEWAERVGVSKFTAYRWFREAGAPAVVNTAFRRPFVCFIPLI